MLPLTPLNGIGLQGLQPSNGVRYITPNQIVFGSSNMNMNTALIGLDNNTIKYNIMPYQVPNGTHNTPLMLYTTYLTPIHHIKPSNNNISISSSNASNVSNIININNNNNSITNIINENHNRNNNYIHSDSSATLNSSPTPSQNIKVSDNISENEPKTDNNFNGIKHEINETNKNNDTKISIKKELNINNDIDCDIDMSNDNNSINKDDLNNVNNVGKTPLKTLVSRLKIPKLKPHNNHNDNSVQYVPFFPHIKPNNNNNSFSYKDKLYKFTRECNVIKKGVCTPLLRDNKTSKNFKCECGRKFKYYCNLKSHYRSHTNNAYICPFCKKRFGRKGNYSQHLRVHTGETPFQCRNCKRKFKQRTGCREHIKRCLKGKNVDLEYWLIVNNNQLK